MKNWQNILRSVLIDGGPSTCQFAITNVCNAACDFCSFNRNKLTKAQSQSVELSDGMKALEVLRSQGTGFMIFTGGEPTVHRNWLELLQHSDRLGMVNLMVTNGSTLSPRTIEKFQQGNLKALIISIDSQDLSVHESNRGLAGVTDKIRTSTTALKKAGIGVTASVTLNRLLTSIEQLPNTLSGLGFDAVTFSFPLTSIDSSYLGAADSSLVTFSREETHRWIEQVENLKKAFPVLNPSASLKDMHAFLDGTEQVFPCFGGWKQFYLDWNLLLWRCSTWNKPMCHVFDFDGSQRVRDNCQACMVDCYRDASVQQYVAISMNDSIQALKKGEFRKTIAHVTDPKNIVSLRATFENMFWLKQI